MEIDTIKLSILSGSIILTFLLTILIKKTFHKYKKPNGKKGGIVSIHIATAVSIIVSTGLMTHDWITTSLMAILVYIIIYSKYSLNDHYTYQIIASIIIGCSIPVGIYYTYEKYGPKKVKASMLRESYDTKPKRAIDNRHEADAETDLILDD